MPDSEAKIRVSARGDQETVAKLKKVGAAQDGLTTEGKKATAQADKQADATKKLHAAEGDFVDVLRRVHPLLGDMVDGLLKGSKVAGQMASEQITLTGVTGKATAAIKKHAGALKLLAAGTGVIVALAAIGKAVAQMRKEWEQATAAVQAYMAAQSAAKQAEAERKGAVEKAADTRREGGLTAEQASRAAAQVESVRKQYGFLDEGALTQVAGLYGGQGIGNEEMAKLAFLQQTGKLDVSGDMSPGGRVARARAALSRHREAIETAFAREAAQRQEQFQEVVKELEAGFEAQTSALQAIAARELEGEGFDLARIARIARALPEAVERVAERGVKAGATTGVTRDEIEQVIETEVENILNGDDFWSRILGLIPGAGEDISAGEMAAAERVHARSDPTAGRRMQQQQAELIRSGGRPIDDAADKHRAAAGQHSEAASQQKQAAGELIAAAGALQEAAASLVAAGAAGGIALRSGGGMGMSRRDEIER